MISRKELHPQPLQQFLRWYEHAQTEFASDPLSDTLTNAMVLATATPRGAPSARVVLYKGVHAKGILFVSNYGSRKARELKANSKAALVFHWQTLQRQIRIEGKVARCTPAESDRYWVTRPRESQLGALASRQSSKIKNRAELERKLEQLTVKFQDREIPRPNNWGGYYLVPSRVEFWEQGPHRIHDRFCYHKQGRSWKIEQLAP